MGTLGVAAVLGMQTLPVVLGCIVFALMMLFILKTVFESEWIFLVFLITLIALGCVICFAIFT